MSNLRRRSISAIRRRVSAVVMRKWIDISELASGDDATSRQDHSGFTATGTAGWMEMTQHVNTNLSSVAAWRFVIPNTLDPAKILSAQLRVKANNTTTPIDVQMVVEKSPAATTWSGSTPNRPSERYAAAVAAGATERWWAQGVHTSGPIRTSPDITTDLKALMVAQNSFGGSSFYVGILAKAQLAVSGRPIVTNQLQAFDFGTAANRPVLHIEYEETVSVAPSAVTYTNVNYSDSYGGEHYRECDIYLPAGFPPPGGWPVVCTFHGGFWQDGVQTRANIDAGFISFVRGLGYAVVNSSYKLSLNPGAGNNTSYSFPDPALDMETLRWFLETDAALYNINPNRMFALGVSAGGQSALFSALSYGDTRTYAGRQNSSSNRGSGRPATPGFTRPNFRFTKGLTTKPWKGVSLWAAPVDMSAALMHPDVPTQTTLKLGRTLHMGDKSGFDPSSGDLELNVNSYITGAGLYSAKGAVQPVVPICYVESTTDTLVLPAFGVTALKTALATSGFTYPVPSVGTVSATGLTHFQVAHSHETIIQNTTAWANFASWLAAVDV